VINYYPFFVGLRFFTSGSRNRLASFISVLAISGLVLGVAMLIIVLSVMNGFDREMRTRILGVIPHIQLFAEEDATEGIVQWQGISAKLAALPQVESVTPFSQINGIVNFRGQTQAIQLRGISTHYSGSAADPLLANLSNFQSIAANEIMLPRLLASKLGIKPGQKLTFIAPQSGQPGGLWSGGKPSGPEQLPAIRALKVAALFSTHTTIDAHLGVVSLATASDMAGLESGPLEPAAQGLRITVEDVFAARNIAFDLLEQLPAGYRFIDWMQTHGHLYQAIQMSRKLVGLLVFLIIAIAAFNVIAMLVMSVVDKRPDIAILKTQGATPQQIMVVFFIQGALIGLLGTLLGALLGCLGAYFVSAAVVGLESLLHIQFLDLSIYPIDYVPSDLRFSDVGTVVAVALVLNLLATLYPAWKAARVQPALVLRHE